MLRRGLTLEYPVRATRLIMTPMKKTLGDAVQRLERSAKAADQTALATELLRAARFREGTLHTINSLLTANMTIRTVFEG